VTAFDIKKWTHRWDFSLSKSQQQNTIQGEQAQHELDTLEKAATCIEEARYFLDELN
jgi:hypothetical protein